MGKDAVSRQCFQKCWAAIISLEFMQGPYPESTFFLLWFTQSQVLCANLDFYSTETPQICQLPLPHLSPSLLGPITKPGVQRWKPIFPLWTYGSLCPE